MKHRTPCLLVTVLCWGLLSTAWAQNAPPATATSPSKLTRVVVQSLMQATLSAEIAARIVHLPWRDGDSFKKGDTLVGFDCAIFEAQRDKVGAELKAASAKLDNDRELERSRSIGALEVVLSEVAVARAQAEMRMAQINTERCVITAPWAGRILQRRAQELEVAKLHQEVMSIVSIDALEVMAVVPGQWVRSLKSGQIFEVRIDETGSRHSAEVVAMGSQVDPVSQTINVRARIARDPRLLPGMTGTAHVR